MTTRPPFRSLFLLTLVPLLLGPPPALACDSDCQEQVIADYFERLDALYRQGSSSAEIDAIFELMGEDVRYVHVEYEADFDREEWRAAFHGNLERGAYAKSESWETRITNRIVGRNHVAVEYVQGELEDAEALAAADRLLVVFRFVGDEIVRVEELW